MYGIFRAYKTFWKKNSLKTAVKIIDVNTYEFGKIANFQIDENIVTFKEELNPVIITD